MNIFNQKTELDEINENMIKNSNFVNTKHKIEEKLKNELNVESFEWIKNDDRSLSNLYLNNVRIDQNKYERLNDCLVFPNNINLKDKNLEFHSRYRIKHNNNIYYMISGIIKYTYGEKHYITFPFVKSSLEFERIIIENPSILSNISNSTIDIDCGFDYFKFKPYIILNKIIHIKENDEVKDIDIESSKINCKIHTLLSSNKFIIHDYNNDDKISLFGNNVICLNSEFVDIELKDITEFTRKLIIQYAYVKEYSKDNELVNIEF